MRTMELRDIPTIPIAGGGIAGLTAALSLARHGITSRVYEKAPAFEELGAGIQLSPNAMKVLIKLGSADALGPYLVEPSHIVLADGKSDAPLVRLPVGDQGKERYGAPYAVVHRADLQKVLVEACDAHANVQIILGQSLDPASTDGLVIAADGVHSSWREVVQQKAEKQFTGHIAWRRVTNGNDQPDDHVVRLWLGPKAHLVDYPIRAGAARNIVAIARTPSPTPSETTPLDAFSHWHPRIKKYLGDHTDWTPWPLYSVAPDARWVTDNVALIGDAAHAMLPFLAQGGAMAIEDAWVLADSLAHSASVDQGLSRYEARRKRRVLKVWHAAKRNGRLYHLSTPLAMGRNAVMRARNGISWMSDYDWLYQWNPPALD
ncbi:MAG: FAD-dependent monooxygenase [Pseudomonadota bacterium]